MQQTEEDGYPMYSPYVETDPLSIEDIPVKEDDDGPAWFFVVRICCEAAFACCVSCMRKLLAFAHLMSAVHVPDRTLVYTIGDLAIGLIQTWWYV